ncbi:MAG: dihydroorotase [Gemmatimonadetes bacterium]|nr:dihydroorotase [Gemmatimonadota bacterium]MYH54318.1 dihydroorotase [Gemmatimonadota bacterium]MYK67075.1 dihydroorotase [Gemmatimonadota bacterium]
MRSRVAPGAAGRRAGRAQREGHGRVLIRGGRVIDPAAGTDGEGDVLVEGGRIAEVGTGLDAGSAEVVDAAGLVVAPGFVDPHVHLCEPGWEHRETIRSGARAAAAGGYTAVCGMPDTDPVVDDPASVGFIVAEGRRAGGARVFPAAAVSAGRNGKQLTEFGEVVDAGAVAVTDAGRAVESSVLMRLALQYALSFDIPVLAHCEDAGLARGGVMHEGVVSTRLGLRGKPAVAEEIGVARDLALAEATGGRLHIQRVSTAAAVNLVRLARQRGVRVTAEATPHHLLLTHDVLASYGTEFKVDPPLRTAPDAEALREALADGTIDCVATDHAPRHYDEKEQAFDDAPFGVVGLETAFAVLHTRLVRAGALALPALLERMSTGPARALGMEGGTLAPGRPADLVLIDPGLAWTIESADFVSRGRNTPFDGEGVVGRVVRTMVGGETVWALDEGA